MRMKLVISLYVVFFVLSIYNDNQDIPPNSLLGTWITTLYLGYKESENRADTEIYEQKIPYEISATDENFIEEAAKLTNLALSELDSCQHRIILKLKTDCDKLNDELLSKMAVLLLNCQSLVEGRQIYPCADEMSLRDCTINMDSGTWKSYHIMSNRARAVCYTVRQSQFRGLAEHTVNKLMNAARDQLKNLRDISSTQIGIKELTEKTYLTLKADHKNLFEQQDDLKKNQLTIQDNKPRLANEKRLIAETHTNLVVMTKNIQQKLEAFLEQLHDQSDETKFNHRELINDLLVIQEKSKDIFERIEQSSSMLIQQNEDFNLQYKSTLRSLQEMNRTVSEIVSLVRGTWSSVEERMTWIVAALGGTDMAIDRIYLIFWHTAFVLTSMLACTFLAARSSTRLLVILIPAVNITVALLGELQYLDLLALVGVIGICIAAQTLVIWALSVKPSVMGIIAWKNIPKSNKSRPPPIPASNTIYSEDEYEGENTDTFQDFNITSPESRNGHYVQKSTSRSRSRTPLLLNSSLKISCRAKTRMGTRCKLSSLPGRYFCFRHPSGKFVAD